MKQVAGTDATEQFYGLHTKDSMNKYHDKLCVGVMEGGHLTEVAKPEQMTEELVSFVPYAEIPMLRENWAKSPWWTESHRDFLLGMRKILLDMQPEFNEIETSGTYVDSDTQQRVGKTGILACLNGMACMPVAQKLKDEGKLTFPGGIEPKDFDLWHEYLANQEWARAVPMGVRNGISGGMAISMPAIATFWKHPECSLVVEQIILGEKRSCLAISEPHAGSDVAKIVTTARLSQCGGYYIVNGIKKWITAGINADFFSVAVRTGDTDSGRGGISFLLIDKNHPKTKDGIDVKHIKTSDAKAAATAYVYLDDCYVPVENLMGQENDGFKLIMANFNHERWLICAGVMGGIRMILKDCFLWVMQRKVFGKALIQQAVIRNKLAQMIGAIESLEGYMEAITYQMANMDALTAMSALGGPTAILKYQTTRIMTLVVDQACQIFGGRALTASGMGKNVESIQRTYKFASILGGSEEIMADLGVRQALQFFPPNAKL
jgi:alkylation response protein AidB-like acyl-CoA dehydrogenase